MPVSLLTLNVHNPVIGPDIIRLRDFFNESGAEVLALSECSRVAFDALATALDCKGTSYAPAPFWGNGILTRSLPLHPLESVIMSPLHSGEERSAAVGEITVHGTSLRLVSTHLAHGSEEERQHQLAQLTHHTTLDLSSSILLGDLNALTRTDYTDSRWQVICGQRKRAGISPPSANLMDGLRDGLHFADAVDASSAPRHETRTTSRFGTRVDYILRGPTCAARWVPDTYRVVPTRAQNISDHEAVAVDIEVFR